MTDSRFNPPTQTHVPDDNPLKGLIEAFDTERARIEQARHDDPVAYLAWKRARRRTKRDA